MGSGRGERIKRERVYVEMRKTNVERESTRGLWTALRNMIV